MILNKEPLIFSLCRLKVIYGYGTQSKSHFYLPMKLFWKLQQIFLLLLDISMSFVVKFSIGSCFHKCIVRNIKFQYFEKSLCSKLTVSWNRLNYFFIDYHRIDKIEWQIMLFDNSWLFLKQLLNCFFLIIVIR